MVSYRHLSGLLRYYGEDSLTVTFGPAAVDGLMIVCSAALYRMRTLTADQRAETADTGNARTTQAQIDEPRVHDGDGVAPTTTDATANPSQTSQPVTVPVPDDAVASRVTPDQAVTPAGAEINATDDAPPRSGRPTREQQRADLLAGRAWLVAERAAGRWLSGADLARAIRREPRWGQRLIERVDREEKEARESADEGTGLRAVR